jgi:antitoxin component YwqK of YwqJK toxin-antitoxin module
MSQFTARKTWFENDTWIDETTFEDGRSTKTWYSSDKRRILKIESYRCGDMVEGKEYWNNGNTKDHTIHWKNNRTRTVRFHENGEIKSEESYNNGKKEGYFVYRYADGKIEMEKTYKIKCGSESMDDIRRRITKQINTMDYYQYKRKIAEEKCPIYGWSDRQKLINILCEKEDGQLDGKQIYWYADGQIKSYEYYKNGVRHGESKFWYENGKIWAIEVYRDGKLEGEIKVWHENGQISIREFFRDGNLIGERKVWTEDGNLTSTYVTDKREINLSWETKYALLNLKRRLYLRRTAPVTDSYVIPDLSKIICAYVSG